MFFQLYKAAIIFVEAIEFLLVFDFLEIVLVCYIYACNLMF